MNYSEKSNIDVDKLKENHKDNILILKSQKRFKKEAQEVFTVEANEIALNAKNDKRIQSIDCKETNAYEISDEKVRNNEEIGYGNTTKRYIEIINVTGKNLK